MNQKISLKFAIISIAIVLAVWLVLGSNAQAQWGWGPQSNFGGWGAYNSGGPWSFGYGGGSFGAPFASFGVSSASKTERRWAGWNDDDWETFIEELQDEYPDLEGIDWETWEDWDEEDWEDLRDALQEVKAAEDLDDFIEELSEKWAEYDNDDWVAFADNWDNFIDAADSDIRLTWAGFKATYGCSDAQTCMENYGSWTEDQWEDFRGIYSDYLEYEYEAFNETLEEKLEDYYTVDWTNWRNWSDEDWEDYLDKYSDFRTSSSSGSVIISPVGYGFGGFGGFGGYGGYGGGFGGGYGGYGFGGPSGYGWGAPGYGYGGYSGGYGWGSPGGYSGYGGYGGGYGGYGGYGWGVPSGYGWM